MKTDRSSFPLFFDGAFGTYYRGEESTPERAVLTDPDGVAAVHRAYLDAGAKAVKTDSFGVNRVAFPDPEERKKLIGAAFSIASSVCGEDAEVFADIGPVPVTDGSAVAACDYLELAELFCEAGAKNFLFETQNDFEPLAAAVRHVRKNGGRVFVSFAVGQNGRSSCGKHYFDLLDAAAASGADAVGLNCLCGPAQIVTLAGKYLSSGRLPQGCVFSAMPNAGYPVGEGGRVTYAAGREYFASKIKELFLLGVSVLGGCCGTSPEYISASIRAVSAAESSAVTAGAASFASVPVRPADGGNAPGGEPTEEKDNKKDKTVETNGKDGFLIAAELAAPDGTDISWLVSAAEKMKDAGADLVTIPDSPLARARADSMLTAVSVIHRTGADTLPHLSCRDRNRIALRGSLLAAYIEGVRSVLAITGDPVPVSDREGRGVFCFSSFGLIEFIAALNKELFSDDPYRICGALNVSARNFDAELKRAEKKVSLGATVLLSQPVCTGEHIANLKKAASELDCRICAGILPPGSYRNAVFLNNEVPGITVPDRVVEMLRDKEPEQVRQISVGWAKEIMDSVADFCGGYYLMTPLKKTDFTADLVRYAVTLRDRRSK